MKVNQSVKNQQIQTPSENSNLNHNNTKELNKQESFTSPSSYFMWMPGQKENASLAPGDVSAPSTTTTISQKLRDQYQGFQEAVTASIMPAFDPIIFRSILNVQSEVIKNHLFLNKNKKELNSAQLPLKPVFFPVEDAELVKNFLDGKNFDDKTFDGLINKMVDVDGYDGATSSATIESVTTDIKEGYLNLKQDEQAIAMLLARACFIPLPPDDDLHAEFVSQMFPKLKNLEIDIHGLPGKKTGFADNARLKGFDGQISASDIVRLLNVFKPSSNHQFTVAACYGGDETPSGVPLQSRIGNHRENTLAVAISEQLKREFPSAPSVVRATQGVMAVGPQLNSFSEDNWADIGEPYAKFGLPELLQAKLGHHIMFDEIQPHRFSKPAADVTVYYPNSSNPHLHGDKLLSSDPQGFKSVKTQSEVIITSSVDIQTDPTLNDHNDHNGLVTEDKELGPMVKGDELPILLPNMSYLKHLDPMPILKVVNGQPRETQIELNDLPALSLADSMKFPLGSDRNWEGKWAPSDENIVSRSIGTSTSESSKFEKFTQTTPVPERIREISETANDTYPNKARYHDIKAVPAEIIRGVNKDKVGVNQGTQTIVNGVLPFGVISDQIKPYPIDRPDWFGNEPAGADARYTVSPERQREIDAWDEERTRRLLINSQNQNF